MHELTHKGQAISLTLGRHLETCQKQGDLFTGETSDLSKPSLFSFLNYLLFEALRAHKNALILPSKALEA